MPAKHRVTTFARHLGTPPCPHHIADILANRGYFCCKSKSILFLYQNSFEADIEISAMYRCHFISAGRIAQGCHIKVATLDAAIATARKILADLLDDDGYDRLEIWLDSALLYVFSV